MRRVFVSASFFCMMCIPVFAMERNVWTCSASTELHFEIANEPVEELITPDEELVDDEVSESVDELELISEEGQVVDKSEFITQNEDAEQLIEEPDEELTDEGY